MRDVEPAQRKNILVIGPLTFHQADLETFVAKKTFLDGGKDGRFAS